MRTLLRTAAIVAVLAFAGLALAGMRSSDAAFSGQNGKIVFVSDRDGNEEIYIMNDDGTGQTNLTNNPDNDYLPVWSADGMQIAFSRYVNSVADDVFVMNPDGTGQTNLTNDPTADEYCPAWSPDGTMIAYTRWDGAQDDIYVMNADGSNPTQLTTAPDYDWCPSWSTDGTKIAFASSRDGNDEIYVMNPDGTGQTNLTNTPTFDEYSPDWSPDDFNIAYERAVQSGPAALPGPQSDMAPPSDLYVMNSDGSNQIQLTNEPDWDELPDWAPDGTKITFSTDRDPTWEVYMMNPDGTGQTNISNNATGDDWGPDWQPVSEPTPTPTTPPGEMQVVWGDHNCSGAVDPIDALLNLRYDAGLSTNTGDCPEMGTAIMFTIASVQTWGDLDCSGMADPIDALKALRFDSGLSVSLSQGCPDLGSMVTIAVPVG